MVERSLDLFFELSSEDRLSILKTLQEKPSKLTELSTERAHEQSF